MLALLFYFPKKFLHLTLSELCLHCLLNTSTDTWSKMVKSCVSFMAYCS